MLEFLCFDINPSSLIERNRKDVDGTLGFNFGLAFAAGFSTADHLTLSMGTNSDVTVSQYEPKMLFHLETEIRSRSEHHNVHC